MPRSRRGWLPVTLVSVITAAVAGETPLAPGAELQSIEATTLDGTKTVLPKDGHGQRLLIVVGFTKAAAKTTRPWLEACRAAAAAAPTEPGLDCYDVRMVEDVPRMLRGMMEHGMKSGLPPELRKRTLLVYEHYDSWRERLGATDDKTAYVVACDAEGIVRGRASGPYAESEMKKLLEAIARPPARAGSQRASA